MLTPNMNITLQMSGFHLILSHSQIGHNLHMHQRPISHYLDWIAASFTYCTRACSCEHDGASSIAFSNDFLVVLQCYAWAANSCSSNCIPLKSPVLSGTSQITKANFGFCLDLGMSLFLVWHSGAISCISAPDQKTLTLA